VSQATPLQTTDAVGFGISSDCADNETRYADDAAILTAARCIAENVLRPAAQDSDRMPLPNRANLAALGEAGLLGLTLPEQWGGLNASPAVQWEYTQILAEACGVTTFVQAQHHGPSRMIANSGNDALKQATLPDLATGRTMCGISFAHLRRPGPSVLTAEETPDGYRLNGTAPWVTGWGVISQVVFGASLPNERFVYVWSPLRREDFRTLFTDLHDGGSLSASEPLALCAMNASGTVEITLRDWFIPRDHALSFSDRETLRRNDRNGVLNAASMSMGCAAAGVRLLTETADKRDLPAVRKAAESFAREWSDLRAQATEWNTRTGEPEFFENAVRLRAAIITFGIRAAQAAVASASGAANSLNHPAQRLLREAMFYSVQAQTSDVMAATLERLMQVEKN
jgi:alkylation response protein AidB-like acyl-CoA dehydrogenase